MISLLLGIIALVIAIMFATSFDKLANEIRDMRIKYLKIDYVLRNLESENGNLHRHRIQGSRYISPEPQQEEMQEEEELATTTRAVTTTRAPKGKAERRKEELRRKKLATTTTLSPNEGFKIESAMTVDEDEDYYSKVNYTENFSTNDIIEEFD